MEHSHFRAPRRCLTQVRAYEANDLAVVVGDACGLPSPPNISVPLKPHPCPISDDIFHRWQPAYINAPCRLLKNFELRPSNVSSGLKARRISSIIGSITISRSNGWHLPPKLTLPLQDPCRRTPILKPPDQADIAKWGVASACCGPSIHDRNQRSADGKAS